MTPGDLIDDYVARVAARLPHKERKDIAAELRALLMEQLARRAANEEKPADLAMVRAVLNEFGDPQEVANRYRPAGVALIDPAQSGAFLKTALIGIAVQWALGIATAVSRLRGGESAGIVLPHLFFSWGLGALWWPGFLVACAAVATWIKGHKAARQEGGLGMNGIELGRIGSGIGALFAALAAVFYIAPGWWVSQIVGGGYHAGWITYTDEFRTDRLPALIAYMTANVVLLAVQAWLGPALFSRRLGLFVTVIGVAVMSLVAFGGKMFVTTPTDQFVRAIMAVLALVALFDIGNRIFRETLFVK